MPVYAALLRGVNVGGKKVNMAQLKLVCESLGLRRVQTYINSGNVLFESGDAAETLTPRIEKEIEAVFGFPVAVIVRTTAELERAVSVNPFADEGSPEQLHLHVGYLAEVPSPDKLERIQRYVNDDDRFRVIGKDMYIMLRNGVRDSKLAAGVPKIGTVTLRNWNTANKLYALAKAMEN